MRRERRRRAGLGLGRGESARARPGSSPGRKLWNGMLPPAFPNSPGGPAQPSPCPPSEPKSRLGGPSLPHPGGPKGKSGEVEGQVGFLESSGSLLTHHPEGQTKRGQGPRRARSSKEGTGCTEGIRVLSNRDGPTAVSESLPPPPSQKELWKGRPHSIGPEQALRGGGGGGFQEPSTYPRGGIQRLLSRRGTDVAMAGHPAKPRARKQKSQDETLDTGPHRPRGSHEGHRPERPMPPPALPQPRLATSLSLRPSGPPDTHPNMA